MKRHLYASLKWAAPYLAWLVVFHMSPALAAPTNGILNDVTQQFQTQTATWAGTMTGYATWLFWTLGTISLAWTGGTMILRRADVGEFFAEFIRFILFFGFFLWLLRNAPAIGTAILNSFITMGASGSQTGVSNPSAVMDIGFQIFHKVMEQTTIWSPVDSFIGAVLAGIVLVSVALIAANMTILLCAAWILLYGGIFFLGFGGARWTSEIAIHYYKSLIGIGASLMAMILMIGIAQNIITNYYNQMSAGIQINQIAAIMVVAIILMLLVHRVPGLITGVLTGASVGHSGIATFGHSSALSTIGMATTAGAISGAMVAASARHAIGGGFALQAAMQSAQQSIGNGNNTNSSQAGSPVSKLAAAMDNGPRLLAHMGKSLMHGIGKEFKETQNSAVESLKKDTFGGKVAGHIKNNMANALNNTVQPKTAINSPPSSGET